MTGAAPQPEAASGFVEVAAQAGSARADETYEPQALVLTVTEPQAARIAPALRLDRDLLSESRRSKSRFQVRSLVPVVQPGSVVQYMAVLDVAFVAASVSHTASGSDPVLGDPASPPPGCPPPGTAP